MFLRGRTLLTTQHAPRLRKMGCRAAKVDAAHRAGVFEALDMARKVEDDVRAEQFGNKRKIRVDRGGIVAPVPRVGVVLYPLEIQVQLCVCELGAVDRDGRRPHVGGLESRPYVRRIQFAQGIDLAAKAVPKAAHAMQAVVLTRQQ